MIATYTSPLITPEVQLSLERHIRARTYGRIRHLSVQTTPTCVVVKGRAQCYYVKQLAIHALRELLGEQRTLLYQVDIEVEPDEVKDAD
jgi:hypothetical protein